MNPPTDDYILTVTPDEIRRLDVQAQSLAGEAAIMLDMIGVAPGWRCADLGCGTGGIVDLLSERVGPAGAVVGLDRESASLAAARARARESGVDNASFVAGDIFEHTLPAASFDLVHVRYVMTTVGRHEEIFAADAALVRPGGVLALEEADADGLRCYPDHAAWGRLKAALCEIFARVGDPYAGGGLYRQLRRHGFEDLDFRACMARARSHDALADYLPETLTSVRDNIVDAGLMTAAELDDNVAALRRHLADPDTISTSVIVIQAWGRKPA